MNLNYQYTSFDKVEGEVYITNNENATEVSKSILVKNKLKNFIDDFLNIGNIFQSFIGTSILTLPYYCYTVI